MFSDKKLRSYAINQTEIMNECMPSSSKDPIVQTVL